MIKKMKHLIFVLVFAILCSSTSTALAAGSFSNFDNVCKYADQFTDVGNDWFAPYVKKGYELGLVKGSSASSYSPNGNVTIAETITLAARIHSIYTQGKEPDLLVPQGGHWYDPYVNYAVQNGIIDQVDNDISRLAMRSDVAVIFANALPSDALRNICPVADGGIPDVTMSADYAQSVYKLYRAGIFTGSDSKGSFLPGTHVHRSEIAAILIRMADPASRSTKVINQETSSALTAEQIGEKCSPSVFSIQVYGYNGKQRGTASGFFISSDGLAYTNFHVVANAYAMSIQTKDGSTYKVRTVLDVDPNNDLALIKVDGSGFTPLPLGDSASLKQGATVYAIGSPNGFDNTLTQGLVSNPSRELHGVPYIQISAQITFGNSGGALISDKGEAIGITSGGLGEPSADLNLAVPINLAKLLDKSKSVSAYDMFSLVTYSGYTQAVDFGDFTGVKLLNTTVDDFSTMTFSYDSTDFTDGDTYAYSLLFYSKALISQGFIHTGSDLDGVYESNLEKITITIDLNKTRTINICAVRKPQYYESFPRVLDFGWFSMVPCSDAVRFTDGGCGFYYNYSDYISQNDFEAVVEVYMKILQQAEFSYKGYLNDSYLFEGNGTSIVITFDVKKVYIDIKAL